MRGATAQRRIEAIAALPSCCRLFSLVKGGLSRIRPEPTGARQAGDAKSTSQQGKSREIGERMSRMVQRSKEQENKKEEEEKKN